MSVNVSTGFAAAILGPQSFATIFNNGVIEVYSGPQPATADATPTGTLLARVTRDGGAWSAGSPANGLQFTLGGRYAIKNPGHVWLLKGLATGVAGWFRLLPNAADDGLPSVTAPRIDGAVGIAGDPGDYQLFLADTNVVPATSVVLTQWFYAIPPLGE